MAFGQANIVFVAQQRAMEIMRRCVSQSFDQQERKARYQDVAKIVNDGARGIIWSYAFNQFGIRKSVKGFDLGGEGKGRFQMVSIQK